MPRASLVRSRGTAEPGLTSQAAAEPGLTGQAAGVIRPYLIACCILAAALLVVFRDSFLPDRFFYDGQWIEMLARGQATTTDDSYGNAARAYAWLGLEQHPVLTGVVAVGLFVAVLVAFYARLGLKVNWSMALLGAVGLMLAAVYLGYYSKDAFVLPIVAAVVLLPRSVWWELVPVGMMLLLASTMRSYWFLVAGLYVAWRIVLPLIRSGRILLIILLGSTAVVSLLLSIALGVSPTFFRESVNDFRVGSTDAESMIQPFVSLPDPLGGVINVVLTQVNLALPFALAAKGGIYYLVLSALIATMWVLTMRGGFASLQTRGGSTGRAFALLLAFLTTQALFEPDYGSALRHLTPLVPLMVVIASAARRPTATPGPGEPVADQLVETRVRA